MHVDISKTKGPNGRVYSRALLRTSFRDEQGKVRHQTVANLSQCTPAQIQAIRLALNSPELVQQTHELRQAQVTGCRGEAGLGERPPVLDGCPRRQYP